MSIPCAKTSENRSFLSVRASPIRWGAAVILIPRIVALKVFLKKSYGENIPQKAPEILCIF
jgi:hypothetical protein